MDRAALRPSDPLPRRLWGYLEERFPPGPYALLVAVFFGSGVLAARALSGEGQIRPLGALVVLLAFFHLRIFDEHKDSAADQTSHPERLLSRGVVTLALLRRCALIAIALEIALSAWMGPGVLFWWACAFGFTLLMLWEFGAGEILRRHIVLYAVTHNPVVGFLAMYIHATTGAAIHSGWLWFVGVASLGSLAFEVGRKTRLPAEEVPGVESYSTALGRGGAGLLLAGCALACAACAAGFFTSVGSPPLIPGILLGISALAALVPALAGSKAKAVEGGATLLLLGSLAACGVAAW